MTLIVGILCSDGVVLGADGALTHGSGPGAFTMEYSGALKLEVIGSMITATAGSVGLGQRANRVIHLLSEDNALASLDVTECGVKVAERVIYNFAQTASGEQTSDQGPDWGSAMLLGLVVGGEPQLIEFDSIGFQPEVKGYPDPERGDRLGRFATLGSGQALADPFLAHAYRFLFGERTPTVRQARLAVVWTLEHVVRHNVGGVGGDIKLAALECRGGVWKGDYSDASEARQQISELELHVARFGENAIDDTNAPNIDV